MIAAALRIPAVHTYHTQYEDYVSYIAKGKSSNLAWLSTLFAVI